MIRILSFFSVENDGKLAWLECKFCGPKLGGVPLNCRLSKVSIILRSF